MFTRIFKLILLNSKLNREKFVRNKKNYIESILKNRQQNYNRTITRKMTTYKKPPLSFLNGPNFPNGSPIIYMIIAAIGFKISLNIRKSNNKE